MANTTAIEGNIETNIRSQTKEVSGKITDETGQPLVGVTVSVVGTTTSTSSNKDGNYNLTVPESAKTLSFTLIGYELQQVDIGTSNVVDISLKSSTDALEEVVVVGYGTRKRSDVTGSVTTISEESLRAVPVTGAQQMLQGRAAGVQVVQGGNKPGAGATVRVRGRRSIQANNDPLYVIDGIPITGGINDINPNDIVSMDVLKDASATAIYGSRGANGVIIVTTRRGTAGRTSVNYNNYVGWSNIMRHMDIMNGEEFAEYKREAFRAIGQYDDSDPDADKNSGIFDEDELRSIQNGTYADYPRLMVKTGHIQNHELSINGGSEKTQFNVSFGFFDDEGIIPGQDFTRYNTRVNLDHQINDVFKIGTSMLGTYSDRNGMDVNPYNLALNYNPLGMPYDDEGNLVFLPMSDGQRSNPLFDVQPGNVINRNRRFRLFTSIYGEAQITKDLKFRLNFGPDLIHNRTGNFRGSMTNGRRLSDPTASHGEDLVLNYTWENILTYDKEIFDGHRLDVTGLYSVQTRRIEASGADVLGVPVESMEYYNLGQASQISSVSSNYENWAILSYMGRINYALKDKYLFTLTGRYDGSSRFALGHQWGFFPSAAFAWNVINEDFLQNAESLSNLRFRLSYGETGNTAIDPYQTQGLLARTSYDFGGGAAFGYRPNTIRNNKLRWETTASANAAIEFGFFNNRLSGSLEVYQATTRDLLLPRVLPITGGFRSILENVGSTRNRGIEFSLSTVNFESPNKDGFTWSTDLNLSHNKEAILELSQGKVDDIGNSRFIGEPITVFYDYEKIGIWQAGQEEEARKFASAVGQIRVADNNGNGQLDPDDRKILGTEIPYLTVGFNNRFSYKQFDLSVLAFGQFGNMIKSFAHEGLLMALQGRYNNLNVDYWTPNNPDATHPQPNANQEKPFFNSTLWYYDGSFIKIRNINLGYNFSENIAKKIRAQSLRVYFMAQNPFVFSSYVSKHNGIDPEAPINDTPLARQFMVGLNVRF
ncbi:SusC/RagA family TonB-linked outer membrane protein [Sphingobacterium sp. SGR-19]|uniref:SusC/RagA family TonB-linked outer membrane protein n=1 Tax=Sphingobacterium sp. SGR-19 TaxID=2710886 RepID=UPI0013ED812A|nr:TonB-dependent receptor [Sphingobacterium sp. SGR-19]NGM66577.1 TonB-dependent receptor [Sphingobacterium sp. SGR-19]